MTTDQRSIVVGDPSILGGTLVFVGTRVPVDTLLVHLKAGDTIDDFLEDFPTVSRAQAEAYLDLAGELIAGNGKDADTA